MVELSRWYLVNILHSNADFLFLSQKVLENVGLNKLSFTDVAEDFASETRTLKFYSMWPGIVACMTFA